MYLLFFLFSNLIARGGPEKLKSSLLSAYTVYHAQSPKKRTLHAVAKFFKNKKGASAKKQMHLFYLILTKSPSLDISSALGVGRWANGNSIPIESYLT